MSLHWMETLSKARSKSLKNKELTDEELDILLTKVIDRAFNDIYRWTPVDWAIYELTHGKYECYR